MSYSKSRIKILLDTTYLLPVVGVDVEGADEALEILKGLYDSREAEFYYSPFSMLELLGKLSKLDYDVHRVARGLVAIRESFKPVHPTMKGYLYALRLREKGFRDLIDLLLYTSSRSRGLMFLTRDKVLIEFLRGIGEPIDNILYEEDFVNTYKRRG